MKTQPVIIADLTPAEWDLFVAGYASGHAAGLERGQALADQQAHRAHMAAARVMTGMSRWNARPDTEWMLTATSDELTQAAAAREAAKTRGIRNTNRAHRATRQHQDAS